MMVCRKSSACFDVALSPRPLSLLSADTPLPYLGGSGRLVIHRIFCVCVCERERDMGYIYWMYLEGLIKINVAI